MGKSANKSVIRRRNSILEIVTAIVMITVSLCCIVPFLYIIAISLSSVSAITNNRVLLWPVGFNLDSYRSVLNYPHFFRAYGYTIIYTIGGTVISLALMSLFAYPLSKDWLKGQRFIIKLVVFSMFFTGGMIPNYLLVSSLHLTGTIGAMLIPFAINQFCLIILINFFRSIPTEIEEAAMIDGLGYFGILIRMILPLSRPALATVGLYTAVFFWNNWFYPLIYLKADQYPVMLLLRNIVNGSTVTEAGGGSGGQAALAISVKSAVMLLSSIPLILLYPFLQKYFVQGINVGAVKG